MQNRAIELALLELWHVGSNAARKVLIKHNRYDIYRMIHENILTDDEYDLANDEQEYYRQNCNNKEIFRFVFGLVRPATDPAGWASFSSTTLQLIADHGGFEKLRETWESVKCRSSTSWVRFLQGLELVEQYRFKHSKYITPATKVFLRSGLVSPSQYIVLQQDGWHVVGHEWMTEEEYEALCNERREAERQRKLERAQERAAARARAARKGKHKSRSHYQYNNTSSIKLEDFKK